MLINCDSKKEVSGNSLENIVLPIDCIINYGFLNPLYDVNAMPPRNGKKILWISDSTIFFSKFIPEFTTNISDTNRVFYGNTACDYLNQIRSAQVADDSQLAIINGNTDHYAPYFYYKLKEKIKTQCAVDI